MTASSGEDRTVQWSAARRHYVLFILCVVGLFNFIDRQIVTILLEPIKREFGASDTQMGLVNGVVFAGFYLAASIPLARMADVGARRTLMAVCLGFWSLMTAVGGVAQSVGQLALTRIGVAIGEAGAGPTSHSMISDLYPLKNRATMIALLVAVQALGIGSGVFLGGWLSQAFNWRVAFFVVGVPGILLAALIMLTVPEPPRGMSDGKIVTGEKPSLREVVTRLWSMRSYRCIGLSMLLISLPGYGTLSWGPTFFMRVHNLPPTVVGFWFGVTVAAGLFLGSVVSGPLGDLAGRRDLRWYMRVAGLGPLVAAPLGIAFLFTPNPALAFFLLFLMQFFLALQNPPCMAMVQSLAPIRMRAVAAVVMTMLLAAVGIGVAPVLIGMLNDFLEPIHGPMAIRYSLTVLTLGALGASLFAFASTRWLREDIARTRALLD